MDRAGFDPRPGASGPSAPPRSPVRTLRGRPMTAQLARLAGFAALVAACGVTTVASFPGVRTLPVLALAAGTALAVAVAVLLAGTRLLLLPQRRAAAAARVAANGPMDRDDYLQATPDADPQLLAALDELLVHIDMRTMRFRVAEQQLERAVSARTAELSQSRDLAEAGSQAKSRFLATMSHEIRTPLNGVLGVAELMLKGELNEQQRRYAQTIHRSGVALLHILNDVLDLAKVEAGRLEVERIPFRPREVFDDVLQLFAQSARAKHLRLSWGLHRSLNEQMIGDPHRLRQMVSNLLSNAVKFTENGEVEIRASVRDHPDGAPRGPARAPAGDLGGAATGRLLVFSVRDTGIGIAPEQQAAVFAPFVQGDSSHARTFGGTGLGLTIVHQLVVLMDGSITLDSRPNEGSCFTVALPAELPLEPDAMTRPALLGGLQARVMLGDPVLRADLTDQLGFLGIDLLPDADETWAAVGPPPDFLFIDAAALPWLAKLGPTQAAARLHCLLVTADDVTTAPPGVDGVLQAPWRESALWQRLTEANARAEAPAAGLQGVVLVVEDNEVNAELSRTMFELAGMKVVHAADGAAAVARVATQSFDTIYMDVQMPVMDGFEATRQIRALEARGALPLRAGQRRAWSRLPIVALTANTLAGDRERCLAAGFDDFLSKPFALAQAEASVRRWVRPAG